jgi:tRNA-splicing ligase RtcB
MKVIHEQGSRPIKAWVGEKEVPARVWADEERTQMVETTTHAPDIEDSALTQLKNLARLPFIASNGVAVMPDVHAGIGSTVGTVIATDRAIIPAAVGGGHRLRDERGAPVAEGVRPARVPEGHP